MGVQCMYEVAGSQKAPAEGTGILSLCSGRVLFDLFICRMVMAHLRKPMGRIFWTIKKEQSLATYLFHFWVLLPQDGFMSWSLDG